MIIYCERCDNTSEDTVIYPTDVDTQGETGVCADCLEMAR